MMRGNGRKIQIRLQKLPISFFQEQFSKGEENADFEILEKLLTILSDNQKEDLHKVPELQEVQEAILGLNNNSTAGPDGLTGAFFQDAWDIIKEDIYKMVVSFFYGYELPKFVAHTNLVLLPKKLVINNFSDMRPISLSNFVKKTFSIIIHDWIKKVLPDIISEKQSRFVQERSIAKNILVVQEIITDIRKRGKIPNMVFKLDMMKAYDRVDWLFLTKVNHFDFADDMIILCKADLTTLKKVADTSDKYEKVSGQKINKEKSAIYMHKGVSQVTVVMAEVATRINRKDFPFTYLGCPIFHMRKKKDFFQPIMNKISSKLQGWKGKLLLYGGRAILIKHVLQSIPIHCLSVMNPLANVLSSIQRMFAQIPWSNHIGGKSKHWVRWNSLCFPEGGWGSVEHQILWKIKSEDSSIWFDNWTTIGDLYNILQNSRDYNDRVQLEKDLITEGNVGLLLKVRNPRQVFPGSWPNILNELEGRKTKMKFTKVMWKLPENGWVKYNTDGASRCNPEISSYAFCARNEKGDLIYAEGVKMEDTSNVKAEAYAILQAAIHADQTHKEKVIIQTDSLLMQKVLIREWNYPWNVIDYVEKIWKIMNRKQVQYQHIMREGNQLADHLTNLALTKGISQFQIFSN
ncbi:hypothetical protein FXO37_15408 [Capsicum annuum]|nr:hypothetical protein FXO37_15408 [Capsicum annuum]